MVDAVQLVRNVDGLRAMFYALAAADAVAGLAQARYTAVVPNEEGPACLTVVGMLLRSGQIALVHTFIIMYQHGGNVDTIGARHAVFVVVSGVRSVLLP